MDVEKYVKRQDTVELLGIDVGRILEEVQEELDIYNIHILSECEQIRKNMNDFMELDLTEEESVKGRTRGIYIKSDGSGRVYSIRNLRFSFLDLMEQAFNLVTAEKAYRYIAGAIFIAKFLKQFRIELTERETAICIALARSSKYCALTDENLLEVIFRELNETGCYAMNEEEVYDEMKELVGIGIIEINEGRYEVLQTIYF